VLRKLLPEWREMGTARRAFEALWIPAAGGVGAAFGATVSTGGWVLNVVIAVVFAIAIGAQHRNQRDAVRRGLVSGALFGGFVVLGYHLFGHESDAPAWLLPEQDALLFLLLFVPATPLHQLGAWLRARLHPDTTPAPAPEPAALTP
jgi:hypothetical protein